MGRPFASDAQREKWRELVREGKVTQEQFDARQEATGDRSLPSRVTFRGGQRGGKTEYRRALEDDRRY